MRFYRPADGPGQPVHVHSWKNIEPHRQVQHTGSRVHEVGSEQIELPNVKRSHRESFFLCLLFFAGFVQKLRDLPDSTALVYHLHRKPGNITARQDFHSPQGVPAKSKEIVVDPHALIQRKHALVRLTELLLYRILRCAVRHGTKRLIRLGKGTFVHFSIGIHRDRFKPDVDARDHVF